MENKKVVKAQAVLKTLQGDQDTLQKYAIKTYARGVLKSEFKKIKSKRKAAKSSRKKNR